MKWFLIIILFTSYSGFGQDSIRFPEIEIEEDEEEVTKIEGTISYIENNAEFPGGPEAMYQYLDDSINPFIENYIVADSMSTGKILVQFTIDTVGKVQDVVIINGMETNLDKHISNIISNMPQWTPAYYQTKYIPNTFTLPLTVRFD
jgi:hypothetical protein